MWLACFSILVAILFWQAWSAGPARALGVAVVLSLLVPSWVVWEVAGLPIHMRVAAAAAGLIVYCLHPQATFNLRLNIVDFFGLMLLAAYIASDWTNDGFSWTVPVRAYGEWALPYLAGRMALQSIDDVHGLLPFVVAVSVFLAAISTIESVTRVNVEELAFGNRPVDHSPRNASRMGLKRAFGPTMHPIYFGALQVLLFPWTLYAAARTKRGEGQRWWRWTPWLTGAGVFFSMSRAPQLAVGVVLYVTAGITKPHYRKWLIGLGAAVFVGGLVASQTVLSVIHLMGGELQNIEKNHPTIVIDDERRPYSSALTRVHLFDVYGLAMRRAGWFGFGTDRVTGFPVRVPVGQQHTQTLKLLPWIDNVYILLTLRFGYLGVASFILLGMAAVAVYAQMSIKPHSPGIIFLGSMAGTLVATMLLLMTVWMPHDFGFVYLWSIGAASGLCGRYGAERDPFPMLS